MVKRSRRRSANPQRKTKVLTKDGQIIFKISLNVLRCRSVSPITRVKNNRNVTSEPNQVPVRTFVIARVRNSRRLGSKTPITFAGDSLFIRNSRRLGSKTSITFARDSLFIRNSGAVSFVMCPNFITN